MGERLERWLDEHTREPQPWLVGFAILLGLQISSLWYASPDTVLYLSMARRIAAGGPITALGSPQLAFPPGYPLLLSPAFFAGPLPFLAVSLLQWTTALVLMLGVYRWLRRQAPESAVLLTGLVMLHVSLWIHYRRALSEVAFTALLMWIVIAANAALAAPGSRGKLVRAASVGLAILPLCLVREIGIVVAVGFALAATQDAVRGRLAAGIGVAMLLVAALPGAIGVIAFARHDAAMKAEAALPIGTHVDGIRAAVAALDENFLEGLRIRVSEIGRVVIPGMFKAYGRPHDWFEPSMIVYVPTLLLVAWGWWRIVRVRTDVFALTLPVYLVALVLWPFDAGTRYVLPMLPVVWACIGNALAPLRHVRLTVLAVLLIAHLGVAGGYWLAIDRPRAQACAADWPAVEALATAIGASPVAVGAGVPECVQLMIELRLDRRAARVDSAVGPDAAQWIVAQEGAPPAGFVPRLTAGRYQLLAREGPS